MAKFKAEEVSALQAGGNERARQIYFKEWDPQQNSYPDGSNMHKLRDFVKHVYVDRKYTGERSHERLPKLRLSGKEEFHEKKKLGIYSGSYRSPNYENRYDQKGRSLPGGISDDKSRRYYNDERRSPCFAREHSIYGGFKKSPLRFEVVDDRFRDDGTQNTRESANHRFLHRNGSFGSLSPDRVKRRDLSSPPVARPIEDILGKNAPVLQVGERSKATIGKNSDGSAHNQVIASSGSKGSIDGKTAEEKNQKLESLINFDSDSMPSNAEAGPQTQENHQLSDGGNHKSNESSTKQVVPQVPKPNTLELLLFELSVPSVGSAGSVPEDSNNDKPPSTTSGGNMPMSSGISAAEPPGMMLALPENVGGSTSAPGGNVPFDVVSPASPPGQMLAVSTSAAIPSEGNMPNGNVSAAVPVGQILTSSNNDGPSSNALRENKAASGIPQSAPVEQTLSLFDTFDSTTPSTTSLHVQPSEGTPSQAAPDIHGDSIFKFTNKQQVRSMQQHQLFAFPAAENGPGGQPTSTTKVGDLNNQLCTSLNAPDAQGPFSASAFFAHDVTKANRDSSSGTKSQQFPVETKSIERKELPADLFAASYSPVTGSIPGWQSALPYGMGFSTQYYPNAVPVLPYPNQAKSSNPFDLNNESTSAQDSPAAPANVLVPRNLMPATGIDTNSLGLMAPSYASVLPSSPFASPNSGAYMGPQVHMNGQPSRLQGAAGGYGTDAYFGSLNMDHQSSGGYSLPSAPNSLPSMGGNPFG
ncbi:uncharacterized protein LOC110603331 isoform X2 [Manihot esculenta]|nr:uncharacterized protein LOC110603331 isoform X2 [Manihot esculenta]KAG8635834.1 hypothetical protein MANES_16G068700v8 [Manihot esculenta]KAG8635835.1 hypothetical protein MANES_16G068700v8 [Manihot esculenta]KAG8635836.1 hypothetical protein MANES_16G068700v8 [Manihot esculenta]KAG8635837.1 hypothetical protein MANES_16G068700v8 [Manihot esculenta]KAG8635839.1 hypothetical protein MANES_16G068700v8 [Manihot esculenta]